LPDFGCWRIYGVRRCCLLLIAQLFFLIIQYFSTLRLSFHAFVGTVLKLAVPGYSSDQPELQQALIRQSKMFHLQQTATVGRSAPQNQGMECGEQHDITDALTISCDAGLVRRPGLVRRTLEISLMRWLRLATHHLMSMHFGWCGGMI